MAGLRFHQPSIQNGPSRAEELSELSGLLTHEEVNEEEEEEEEEEGYTETEYDMVAREEAAGMPPRFAHSLASRSYGTVSPSSRRRRRKRKGSGRRRRSGSPHTFSPLPSRHPYLSLSPQALRGHREERLIQLHNHQERRWGSTSALPQVREVTPHTLTTRHSHTHTIFSMIS